MKETLLNLERSIANFPQTIKNIFANFVREYNVVVNKFKNLSATNYNLGVYHIDRCNMNDAKMRFIFTIKLDPKVALAHYHLARCHMFNLDFDKAKDELRIAISLDKNLKAAKYRLNLLEKTLKNDPVPLQVIEEDYDNLADNYESYIEEQQKYNSPELLTKMLAEHVEDLNEPMALDIGCGTGLVGFYLRQAVAIKSLVGIDISKRMLVLAEELEIENRVVYNDIEYCDFNQFRPTKDKYNIITACMSLVYSNDLSKFLKLLEKIIAKQAILGLVLLKSDNDAVIFDYKQGCFSFGLEYLEAVFKKHKWTIIEQKEIKLFANGAKGLLFVLKSK